MPKTCNILCRVQTFRDLFVAGVHLGDLLANAKCHILKVGLSSLLEILRGLLDVQEFVPRSFELLADSLQYFL